LDSRDSVFVNGFSVRSSICPLKISASTVELVFLGDLLVRKESVSSTVFESAVVYVH
jgi:hypothetical protein